MVVIVVNDILLHCNCTKDALIFICQHVFSAVMFGDDFGASNTVDQFFGQQ